jgi:hypothetical protein
LQEPGHHELSLPDMYLKIWDVGGQMSPAEVVAELL